MSFAQSLREGRFPVALEITPPRHSLPAILRRRAGLIGSRATAINVIQRPDRQSSLDASCELRDAGLDAVWHLVARGSTLAGVEHEIARARERGIRQVLCILGDRAAALDSPGPTVRELVALCCHELPGASIGATVNQYAEPRDRVLANLEGKLEAGATYVQTQPVFDLGPLRSIVEPLRDRRPGIQFVPMVMPILHAEAAARVQQRLGVTFPAAYLRQVEAGPAAAWEAFTTLLASLVRSGLAGGIAIMTFEMDPPPGVGEQLIRALDAAGIPSGA
jgi:5,10-methylenetetrahydrofolate reductase